MKLTTNTNVSVDGVMQGLGGPDEDRRGAFERGGWVIRDSDNETMAALDEIYGRADASCSAGGPTRSSPAPGDEGAPRPARSGRR